MSRLWLCASLLLAGLSGDSFAVGIESPSRYSQTYAILIKGLFAGTESVTEESGRDGNLVSNSAHELLVTDGMETKRMDFTTSAVRSKTSFDPIRYSCRYNSGDFHDSYEVGIKGAEITRSLSHRGHSSETTQEIQPGFVLLDFNVYHQYDFLVRKYDAKRGGRQTFQNYIPILGHTIPLALTELDRSNFEYAKGAMPVRNFRIEFVGIWAGTFSTDREGRLVRLLLPAQDLEVVRKDFLPEEIAPYRSK